MFALCLAVAMLRASDVSARDADLVRPHWGVEFRRLGGLTSGASTWQHTFAIPFINPTFVEIGQIACAFHDPHKAELCNNMNDLILDMNEQRQEHILNIQADIKTMKSLIPFQIPSQSTRTKRAILDFVSSIGKSLFGFAKDTDLKAISQHINEIETNQNLTTYRVIQMGSQLSSFVNTTNERLDNAIKMLKITHDRYVDLAAKTNYFEQSFESLVSILTQILRAETTSTSTFMAIDRETERWILGAQTLLEGYLPIQLVSPNRLSQSIQDIEIKLSRQFPLFTISHKDVGYYYQNRDIMFTQSKDYLYISVKIPVSASSSYFDIFSLYSLPVPLNSTTNNATLIKNLPPYFGITRDAEFYTEIDHNVYSTCHGTDVKSCATAISMKSRTYASCASALYFDKQDEIIDLCDIRYETRALFEGAIDLGNSYFLASGSGQSWNQICANSPPHPIQGCNFCLIKLPCGCGISSPTFKIPPKLSDCTKVDQEAKPTYLHPVNLPVLKTMFPKDQIPSVSGSHVFESPNEIHIPDLKIDETQWNNIINKEDKFKMSFKQITDNLDTSNTLFKSQADFLRSHAHTPSKSLSEYMPNSIKTWSLSLVPNILSTISLIISLYVLFKTRKTLSYIALATHTPTAHGYIIQSNQSIMAKPPTLIATNSTLPNIPETKFVIDITFAVMIGFMTIQIIIFLSKQVYKQLSRNNSHYSSGHAMSNLYIELSDHSECVLIKLMTIPACPTNLKLLDINPPNEINYNKTILAGYLTLSWICPYLTRLTDNRKFRVPNKTKLYGCNKTIVNKILKNNYVANIIIQHGHLSFPMTINTTRSKFENTQPEVAINNPTTNLLYPTIN